MRDRPEAPAAERLSLDELRDIWPIASSDERLDGFDLLTQVEAEDLFLGLPVHDQSELILSLPQEKRRTWIRLLAPDDAADLLQEIVVEERYLLLSLLEEPTRAEVQGLLAYAEDDAGGLMNPRYARVRPEQTADEAIIYLRKQAREHAETIYTVYVLDTEQKILGVASFRELFAAPPHRLVREIMITDVITASEAMDQEEVGRLMATHDLIAIPVVDANRHIKGIITVDDIVDVVHEEATEDMHKVSGMEALDAPYLKIGFWHMFQKRGGWLVVLFLGQMLTATAMAYFAHDIEKAMVLALFIPLIISSGGNSGGQATTLVIRAMALGEVKGRDFLRVVRRELAAGLALGALLGFLGFLRIVLWQWGGNVYGAHYLKIGLSVAFSLVGVVMFGTLVGSMLPFLFRRIGFDPASASAPFVATLVDVTGLVIYFTVANLILTGTLL